MIYNPNSKIVEKIHAGLEKTEGHCPCEIERTEDTICPCKNMREQNICKCKLFVPVIVYSAEWCHNCTELKEYLDKEGIKYEVRDISNLEYRDEIVKAGFKAIPVLKLGDLFIDTSTMEYRTYLKKY